jgi:hypothetical protein
VSQIVQPVTQPNRVRVEEIGYGGEAFLRDATTRLRRDIANLNNDNGKTETIGKRIVQILDEVLLVFRQPNFRAPEHSVTRFLNYLQTTAEPVMKANRLQYDVQPLWDAAAGVEEPPAVGSSNEKGVTTIG